MRLPRLLILDADGTLRYSPGRGWPLRDGDWRLLPGVRETLARFRFGTGATRLAVASNQNAVALGELDRATALRMLEDTLRAAVGELPAGTLIEMCCCPLEPVCACRKPQPGMLLRIL